MDMPDSDKKRTLFHLISLERRSTISTFVPSEYGKIVRGEGNVDEEGRPPDMASRRETHTKVKIDTEDIIVLFCGLVAIIFAIAMVLGAVPINRYTTPIAALSAVGAGAAAIVRAKRRPKPKIAWLLWTAVIVLTLVVIGIVVWLATKGGFVSA
jgi:hypothetical protein